MIDQALLGKAAVLVIKAFLSRYGPRLGRVKGDVFFALADLEARYLQGLSGVLPFPVIHGLAILIQDGFSVRLFWVRFLGLAESIVYCRERGLMPG